MSIITKSVTEGIDIKIQYLQAILHTRLIAKWNINGTYYNCYGRVYRLAKKDGFQFEAYDSNGEYTGNIFQKDIKAVMSFFVVNSRPIDNFHVIKPIVDLIYFANLDMLRGSINRTDEEIAMDVWDILRCEPAGFRVTDLVVGIDNVFPGIDISKIKYDDMQPYHIFKFVMNVNYRL